MFEGEGGGGGFEGFRVWGLEGLWQGLGQMGSRVGFRGWGLGFIACRVWGFYWLKIGLRAYKVKRLALKVI